MEGRWREGERTRENGKRERWEGGSGGRTERVIAFPKSNGEGERAREKTGCNYFYLVKKKQSSLKCSLFHKANTEGTDIHQEVKVIKHMGASFHTVPLVAGDLKSQSQRLPTVQWLFQ